jgi:hypothetical protein
MSYYTTQPEPDWQGVMLFALVIAVLSITAFT